MDKRKIEILNAIINSYINSSNPVGSRTLTKEFDLGVSSATIRNEMADLEDLGYLNKPHTSAGRVPSDKAYRFFVDELVKDNSIFEYYEREFKEIETMLLEGVTKISDIYENTTRILAELTNCTSYLISFKRPDTKIKLIQLLKIDRHSVLLIIIGNKGIVEHQLMDIDTFISESELYSISSTLNQYFVGIDIDKIEKLKIILKGNLVNYKGFISNVINRISKFNDKVSAANFYYDGLTNILNFKEYFDVKRAKEFMSLIQDKDAILEIINDDANVSDFSVIIGNENSENLLKENSIIRSTFKSNNQNNGVLGIIGPLRLNYRECVRVVWMVSYNITKTIDGIVR